MRKIAIVSMMACSAAFAQMEFGGVDVQGNLSVLDNLETVAEEGNFVVENNAWINGTLFVYNLNSDGEPFALELGGSVDEFKTGIAMGLNSHVVSSYSLAIGENAVSSGNYSIALGLNASTGQAASLALGGNAKTLAMNSAALGGGSQTQGESSFAAGVNSKTLARASSSLGYITTAESFAQVTIGSSNVIMENVSKTSWVETDPLFVIGNGDGTYRSNALVVLKNGNTTINGTLVVTKPSSALPMGEFGAPESEEE